MVVGEGITPEDMHRMKLYVHREEAHTTFHVVLRNQQPIQEKMLS